MPITVENRTGRLVEIYIREREVQEADLHKFREMVKAAVTTATRGGQRMVVVGDLRELLVVGPTLAKLFGEVMRSDNRTLERSALLTTPHATFGMQLDRVMRESANPNRRRFEVEGDLLAWVAEILNNDELERAHAFLQEGAAPTH